VNAARGTRRPRGRAGTRPPTRRRRAGRATNGCLLAVLLIPYYLIRYYVPAADVPPRAGLTGTGRSTPLGVGCSARPEGAAGTVDPADGEGLRIGGPGRSTNVSRISRGGR
jgi:hypothetical protein